MRSEAVQIELVDGEPQRLVRVTVPTPRRIPADQHVIEPQEHPSPAGGRLRPEDDVDAFVAAEVVELDLESTGQVRFPAISVTVGTGVDLNGPGGTPAVGRGDGDGRADRHSQNAHGADDGDPHGSGQ
jgi:hypothetical protein